MQDMPLYFKNRGKEGFAVLYDSLSNKVMSFAAMTNPSTSKMSTYLAPVTQAIVALREQHGLGRNRRLECLHPLTRTASYFCVCACTLGDGVERPPRARKG